MSKHHDYHGRRAPKMVTQEKPAVVDFMNDVLGAVVRMVGTGDIIEHQQNPRDHLQDKNEKKYRSKGISPPGPTRDRLIQHFGLNGLQTDPFINELHDLFKRIGLVHGLGILLHEGIFLDLMNAF